MSSLYRVVWKYVKTGLEDYGDYMSLEVAEEWAAHGNRKWGTDPLLRYQEWSQVLDEEDDGLVIEHWVESYPTVELKSLPIRQAS